MSDAVPDPKPFRYDAEVEPGEKRRIRYEIGETYLGDPIEIPVTIINGEAGGPTLFLSAGIHGDELNGVKVVQEVADRYSPGDLHGTLVCLHVCNVPAYEAQRRDTPIYDQDMNRSFPGKERSNTTERMANRIYRRFVAQCDLGLDFHTSTQNRTTIYPRPGRPRQPRSPATRAGVRDERGAVRIRRRGSLRSTATADGIPTVTVEMGRAHRFQPVLIEKALEGVESVLAEYELTPGEAVHWPGWFQSTAADSTKRWLRADTGGLVEMEWGPYPLATRARRSAPSRTTSKRRSTRSRPLRRADRRVAGEPGRRPRAPALSRGGQTRRGDAPGDRTRDR